MKSELIDMADDAVQKLLKQLKDDVGDSIENEQVRSVLTIGLSLAERIGDEAFGLLEDYLDGNHDIEEKIAEELTLQELSDLLDVVQGMEARQRVAMKRMIASAKNAGMQVASTLLKAALAAV